MNLRLSCHIKLWPSGPEQNSTALSVNMTCGFGVLESWSIGVLEKAKSKDSINNLYITPLLHHSITPADSRKKGRLLEPPLPPTQSQDLWAWFFTLLFAYHTRGFEARRESILQVRSFKANLMIYSGYRSIRPVSSVARS